MERTGNYGIRREEAKKYFLTFDQQRIIERFGLEHNEEYLFLDFVGSRYGINRKNGEVERLTDAGKKSAPAEIHGVRPEPAGFEEVLSIFDLLCHEGQKPGMSGNWGPVNSLKNRPATIGVQTAASGKYADLFDRDVEAYERACQRLGGTAVKAGDVGYEIPVFREIRVRLKFYRSDEEFPAQITLLWDENTLAYVYYETTFYIMNYLYEKIAGIMEKEGAQGGRK